MSLYRYGNKVINQSIKNHMANAVQSSSLPIGRVRQPDEWLPPHLKTYHLNVVGPTVNKLSLPSSFRKFHNISLDLKDVDYVTNL